MTHSQSIQTQRIIRTTLAWYFKEIPEVLDIEMLYARTCTMSERLDLFVPTWEKFTAALIDMDFEFTTAIGTSLVRPKKND